MIDEVKLSKEFAEAIVKAQGEIEGAKKDKKNDHFRSKYADLASCWDACRDALQANQLAIVQFPCVADDGHIGLETVLVFGPTGETVSQKFYMPLKDKTNPQAAGSALTYARRYALCSVIGICPEDDDGNSAAATTKATSAKVPVQAPKATASVNEDSVWKEFEQQKTLEGMKGVYSALNSSSMPEPQKSSLLKKMADVIKSKKGSN